MKKLKKILLVVLLLFVALILIALGGRLNKDIHKKLAFQNTYAIQNVETGKDIRVLDAGPKDDQRIILYDHYEWECITWEFINLEDSTFLLKNLYTQKTFQPSTAPEDGVNLWQKPLGGTPLQYWQFIKQQDGTYLIKLKGTELYVTISSADTDSDIILKPKNNTGKQKWKLIRQSPWI